MFSNRWYYLKFCGILLLLIFFGVWSQRRYGHVYPDFWLCRLAPDRSHGVAVITGQDRVEAVADGAFEIEENGHRIRVRESSVVPEVGDTVTVVGTYHRDHVIMASEVRIHENFPLKRTLTYAISLATMAVLVVLFARRFRAVMRRGLIVQRGGE